MIPSFREQFNSAWTPDKCAYFLHLLEERFGEPPPFRHSETPCFLPQTLVQEAARAGQEIVDQLIGNPDYLRAAHNRIPSRYCAPAQDSVPLFVQADFGLNENQALKLVEIQGFPSLYGYQPALAQAHREAYGISYHLAALPNGLTESGYECILRKAIVSDHDPEQVVLLEIDPWNQKTRHDFVATQRMLGIAIVDAREVRKRGNGLYYERDGKEIPIKRIYNRVIADESERRAIALPFDFRDELRVEWAGHPNWFFLISKFSLPFLEHSAVPPAVFLSEVGSDADLSSYVLKPLYSFAGLGVIVGPNSMHVANIPADQRCNYILQERVNFTPFIETPEGPTKIEIRVMYVWLERLKPVNLVIRMGRGAQMGVDHNKDMGWVGASAAFIVGGNQ